MQHTISKLLSLIALACIAFAAPSTAAPAPASSNFSILVFDAVDSLCQNKIVSTTEFVPEECGLSPPEFQQAWPEYKWWMVSLTSSTANIWTVTAFKDSNCNASSQPTVVNMAQGDACQHLFSELTLNYAVITPVTSPYIWQVFNSTLSPSCDDTVPGGLVSTWGVTPGECESLYTSYEIDTTSNATVLWYSSVDRIACPLEGNVGISDGVTIGECTQWFNNLIRIIANPNYHSLIKLI